MPPSVGTKIWVAGAVPSFWKSLNDCLSKSVQSRSPKFTVVWLPFKGSPNSPLLNVNVRELPFKFIPVVKSTFNWVAPRYPFSTVIGSDSASPAGIWYLTYSAIIPGS